MKALSATILVWTVAVAVPNAGCTRRPATETAETPATAGPDGPTSTPAGAAACEDVGADEPFSRLVRGADRGCATDEDCVTVPLNCSHLDCTAVHRDHAGSYAEPISCEGYTGALGNYDCEPQFHIEAPKCRGGCCVSENILEERPEPPVERATGTPPSCRSLGESAPASDNGLEAYVSLHSCDAADARELLINVRVWNVSGHDVHFLRMPAWYPMTVFQLRKAGGELIPNGPPPVPPEGPQDDWWVDLTPDMDYLFDASVGQVVAVDLEPGDYELRFAYENLDDSNGSWVGKLETGWVRFAVRGPR